MKKVILITAILFSVLHSSSQIYFAGSFGYGATSNAAVGSATLGLDLNHWLLQGGFSSHLSQKAPTLYRLTAGRSFLVGEKAYINATGGIGSLDRYFDKGEIKGTTRIYVGSLEYAQDFTSHGGGQWFIDCTQSGRYNFLTIGLKYFFTSGRGKTGCPANWN